MARDERTGRWQAGESPNPQGRPRGVSKLAALRAGIAEHVPAIVERLVASALAGDVGASRLLLERVCSPLKAAEEPTPISLAGSDAPLSDQGRTVLTAVAAGALAPGQAAQLLAGLGSLARVVEVDELARRMDEIERRLRDDDTDSHDSS